jgi:hypothetical protein
MLQTVIALVEGRNTIGYGVSVETNAARTLSPENQNTLGCSHSITSRSLEVRVMVYRSRMAIRLTAAALLVPVVAAVLTAFSPTAAQASLLDVDLVCTDQFQVDFDPPLDNNTVGAFGRGVATNCTSPNGSRSELRSGTIESEPGNTATGCSPLPLRIEGTASIAWNTGESSALTYVISTDLTSGDLGIIAHIVGGVMEGGTLTAIPLILTQNGLCGLGGGVKSLTVALDALTFTR